MIVRLGFFAAGLYLGAGISWAMFFLADASSYGRWSLLWRAPFIVMLWPLAICGLGKVRQDGS